MNFRTWHIRTVLIMTECLLSISRGYFPAGNFVSDIPVLHTICETYNSLKCSLSKYVICYFTPLTFTDVLLWLIVDT